MDTTEPKGRRDDGHERNTRKSHQQFSHEGDWGGGQGGARAVTVGRGFKRRLLSTEGTWGGDLGSGKAHELHYF